jgi:hypothetical protein
MSRINFPGQPGEVPGVFTASIKKARASRPAIEHLAFGRVKPPRSRRPSASGRNLQPRQRCQVRARPRAVPAGPACPPAAAGGMRGAGPIFDIPSWYTISSGRVPEGPGANYVRPSGRGLPAVRISGQAGLPAARRALSSGGASRSAATALPRSAASSVPFSAPRPAWARRAPAVRRPCPRPPPAAPEPILVFLRTPGTAEDWPAAILSSTRQNGVSPNGSARPDHLHR